MKHAAIFLDRDGTINEEVDFLTSADELHLLPGSAEAIRLANTLGLKVIVITNQSGIARGLLTEEHLREIHAALTERLRGHQAVIDAFYYCPHHPDAELPQYRVACDCRKPGVGMITRAVQEFSIDPAQSFVIGDRLIDIQTGNAAGVESILVLTGYGKDELDLCRQQKADISFIAADLSEAMQYVRQRIEQNQPSAC